MNRLLGDRKLGPHFSSYIQRVGGRVRVFFPFLLFLGLSSFLSARAADRSMEDYWKETGINYGTVENILAQDNCYKSENRFLACCLALNAAFGEGGAPLALLSEERLQREPYWGEVRASFGPVRLVVRRPPPAMNEAQLHQALRKDQVKTVASWKALYAKRDKVRVPFSDIVNHLKSSELFSQHEKLVSATLLNIATMVTTDPHSYFLPTQYVEDQMKSGDYVGVGIEVAGRVLQGRTSLLIKSLTENGPAHKARLKVNDFITHIDRQAVDQLPLTLAMDKLNGAIGSRVRVRILREGKSYDAVLQRALIVEPKVTYRLLTDGPVKVGYLRLEDFLQPTLCEDLSKAVAAIHKEGAEALVFDLTGNAGGRLTNASCVANLFLGWGRPVLSVELLDPNDEEAKKSLMTVNGKSTYYTLRGAESKLPVVVLVDAKTGSAAEAVAGAIQDYGRGVLVGERTYGKATVQNQKALEGTGVTQRRTVARWLTAKKRFIQIQSLLPDLLAARMPNPTEEDLVAEREEDQYMALPPAGPKWVNPHPRADGTADAMFGPGCLRTSLVGGAKARTHCAGLVRYFVGEQTANCLVTERIDLSESAENDKEAMKLLDPVKTLPQWGFDLRRGVEKFFSSSK